MRQIVVLQFRAGEDPGVVQVLMHGNGLLLQLESRLEDIDDLDLRLPWAARVGNRYKNAEDR